MSLEDENVEGFEIPLHVALTQRVLIWGVPRTQFYIVGVVCLVIGLSLHQPLIGGSLWLVWFFSSQFLTKRDPYFFVVFFRAFKHVLHTWRSGGLEG